MSWWSVGAAVGGALISSSASRSAASQQSDATARATEEQARQYDQTRSDYAPFRQAGVNALGQLQKEMDTPMSSEDVMRSDPGYQFGLDQGQQAIDRKTAAAGGRISGAALKAASEYGQNYATTGYNAAYQRRQDRLNRLQALAGFGQTATAGTAQAGAQTASNNANLMTGLANATGASTIAQGNIWGNAINAAAAPWVKKAQTPTTQG
jgi:hypothetical protein